MGRIKSTMVKKAAKQLLDGTHSFTTDFTVNKRILGSKTMPSKPIRNKVAGYLARLVRMKEAEQRAAAKPKAPVVQQSE